MTDTQRGTDVDLLRKAIAKLTAEREDEARNRYRRAAAPLLTAPPARAVASRGAPGSPAGTTMTQPATSSVDSVKAALLELEHLYNEGLVTIEEYQRKRVEILDRL